MHHLIPRPLPHPGRPLSRRSHPRDGSRSARRRGAGPRLLLLLVVVCVLAAVLAWAVPAYAAVPGADPATARLDTILANATGWLVGILASLATLFLTIGGIRYVMAGGDPGEVEKAKGAFKSAGLGYALAVLAPVVVSIIKGILGV
jgi:Type IV secretion system pilin